MDFKPLLDLIEGSDKVLIRTHENADADAVGSSLAMKKIVNLLGREATVMAPRSVSKLGRILADEVGEKILTQVPPFRRDLVIYVDAMPIDEAENGERVAVIDHHEGHPDFDISYGLIDPSYSSTAEMVYEFIKYLLSLDKISDASEEIGRLLLWGIIADTGGLRLAVRSTLERIIGIAEDTGVEVKDAYSLLRTPPDPSLRMACLKGASRLKIRRRGGTLIVTTEISSFQGDVAGMLVFLGADIAFAGGVKAHVVNVSARARNEVVDAGLSLAQVMSTVAEKIGGRGGGHAGAAALKGQGDVRKILGMCVDETKRALRVGPDLGQQT
jgi:nanoRNase/pAp phosphatase (c-di-AMP/oligoRNAs hydrolase)